MTKFELFILHVPFIGLLFMFVIMNYNNNPLNDIDKHPNPTNEQTTLPIWIQLLSIIGAITFALIKNQ